MSFPHAPAALLVQAQQVVHGERRQIDFRRLLLFDTTLKKNKPLAVTWEEFVKEKCGITRRRALAQINTRMQMRRVAHLRPPMMASTT